MYAIGPRSAKADIAFMAKIGPGAYCLFLCVDCEKLPFRQVSTLSVVANKAAVQSANRASQNMPSVHLAFFPLPTTAFVDQIRGYQ